MVVVQDDLIDGVEARMLFLAVLMQGIKDHVAGIDRAWLSLFNLDFHEICYLAGLEPRAVIKSLRSRDGKRLSLPAKAKLNKRGLVARHRKRKASARRRCMRDGVPVRCPGRSWGLRRPANREDCKRLWNWWATPRKNPDGQKRVLATYLPLRCLARPEPQD